MADRMRVNLSTIMTFIQRRFNPILVLIYAVLGLIVFLWTPIHFIETVRTPFIGAFVEHTLMLNTAQPTRPGAWEMVKYGLPYGYQVAAIEGQPIADLTHMREILRGYSLGDKVILSLRDPDGQLGDYKIELQRLPLADQLSYFVVPYVIGLVYLLSGLYVFGVRRYDPAGLAFALFSTAVAISIAGLFDLYTTSYFARIWTVSLAIVGGALLNLALLFPESVTQVLRYTFLRWLGYVPTVLLAWIAVPTIFDFSRPTAYVTAWRFEFVFIGLSAVVFLVLIAIRRASASSPVVREQARLIFWGALLSFSPLAVWFIISPISPSIRFTAFLLIPLGIFPLFTAYAIVRYRLLSTDYLLSRTVLYAFLTTLVIFGYALLVSGIIQIFGTTVQLTNPLVVGAVVFALALGLNPLRSYMQRQLDTYFFRGQAVYRELLQAFGHDLTPSVELPDILGLLRRYVEQALIPSRLHIYIFDPLSAHYLATPDKKNRPTSDVRFPLNGGFVQTLARERSPLFLADLGTVPEALKPEQARLALLDAQLFIPMPGRVQMIGWLGLGARSSGEPYANRDLEYLTALSDQAALAIERAQVVGDLERRVRETNVLTRISQGVNFTVAFDDILELIYAQSAQILPVRDFRVTLQDEETNALSHAFYIENDERISEHENQPLSGGQGLEVEVLKSQRPIVTDDYERECRGRGLLPAEKGTYAWMGVPLNAGARTIGLISLCSRDPAIVFTDEQRNLLQAIADQAAGAIVKARLLQESERRARQLATLNEIGLGLTSTLDVNRLLNQILQSAAEILNCQAGTLFLVDPQTDELVFEVVLGPAAAKLQGQRLTPGTGLAGQAVQAGQPMIANDAKRRKGWFEKTDQQTGFDTQDLLVVPMRVQDRVIGAIEVINKANGAPFTTADQDLLMTFTNQATIAMENARLYTMTDQALAARVEELSVMQRIDRELNASLEIDRAMRITLDWALRQSGAEAGLVATVEQDNLQVMTSQGYTDELASSDVSGNGNLRLLPLNLPGLRNAVEGGQPQSLLASDFTGEDGFGLLKGAKMQVVIPIRRETVTIGILLLESARVESYSDEMINFLSRLSDHAAIAIANAQLYGEVIEANLAKSRFVSFVAHELKNPMASIKGYTELVAGGMAGPVNEMQSSFLSTVRSNVDRMNTIVSDLNDLTKIQVGSLKLEYRSVQIKEALDEVIRSLRRQYEEKEQRLELSLPESLPSVWADPSRLTQVLTNLVSNAIKYTPQGGEFSIGAERYREKDAASSGVEFVRIWVKDNGIGISEEDQTKIFQQYFRTDTAKEMATGTGLGLNITKSLVEMQGGRIWFDSRVEGGSTFHFTVPVAEAQ